MAMKKTVAKKIVKPQGVGNYKPNVILANSGKKPLTLAEQTKYNKLPKDTIFTLPKGAEKLSEIEKKQIQARRILDRQRTLSRGAAIIRRDTGVKTSQVNPSKPKPKPKPKPKTTFG